MHATDYLASVAQRRVEEENGIITAGIYRLILLNTNGRFTLRAKSEHDLGVSSAKYPKLWKRALYNEDARQADPPPRSFRTEDRLVKGGIPRQSLVRQNLVEDQLCAGTRHCFLAS